MTPSSFHQVLGYKEMAILQDEFHFMAEEPCVTRLKSGSMDVHANSKVLRSLKVGELPGAFQPKLTLLGVLKQHRLPSPIYGHFSSSLAPWFPSVSSWVASVCGHGQA